MVLRGGKTPERPRGRIPLNYYRSGQAESGASPFVRKVNKKGRFRKYFVRTLDLVVLIVLLAGLVYSLFVNPQPQIRLNDTAYRPALAYQAAAAKVLGSLKNRNKITLNESQVVGSLQKQFPEIANATLELPLFSETPILHLTIAKPSFFLTSANARYIVDSQGVAAAIAKDLPQIKNLPALDDQSGFHVQPGQQVLTAQNVAFINTVLAQSARAGVPVKSLVLPTQVDELDLHTADRPYFVKFYLGGDADLQTGQFLAARHNFDQQNSQPSAYLDVRVPGKIFYK